MESEDFKNAAFPSVFIVATVLHFCSMKS